MKYNPDIHHRRSIRLKWYDYSTKTINQIHDTPGRPIWQRNYYEKIILTETDYFKIKQYIKDNVLNWHSDVGNQLL